jgi:simple sugar transport system ATP-binding protein
MRQARDRGLAVLFITHNLHHVFEVADRLVVLSHGRKVGDHPRDRLSPEQAAQLIMEGRLALP